MVRTVFQTLGSINTNAFAIDFVISDDEGDPEENRISPCTFRAWAENCTSWSVARHIDFESETQGTDNIERKVKEIEAGEYSPTGSGEIVHSRAATSSVHEGSEDE